MGCGPAAAAAWGPRPPTLCSHVPQAPLLAGRWSLLLAEFVLAPLDFLSSCPSLLQHSLSGLWAGCPRPGREPPTAMPTSPLLPLPWPRMPLPPLLGCEVPLLSHPRPLPGDRRTVLTTLVALFPGAPAETGAVLGAGPAHLPQTHRLCEGGPGARHTLARKRAAHWCRWAAKCEFRSGPSSRV